MFFVLKDPLTPEIYPDDHPLSLHGALPTCSDGPQSVYLLGNWPAPFGIVLVLYNLSALMLALTSILALASLVFSLARWHRAGVYYHPLFQFLLMGLNGAFLTGDLFNLFVFFEVTLAASYGDRKSTRLNSSH